MKASWSSGELREALEDVSWFQLKNGTQPLSSLSSMSILRQAQQFTQINGLPTTKLGN